VEHAAPTRYRADHVVTGPERGAVHSPGVVDVVDGRVAWSGAAGEAPAWEGEAVDIGGALLPGFVNVHAHTPMVLLRGTGEGLPTDVWLTEVMWPREARLTPDDVRAAMRLGAAEMLLSGITTTCEMYFHGAAIAEGAVAAGLRCLVTAPLIEAPDFAHLGTVAEQIGAIRDLRAAWADHPLVEVGVGPHSAYALSREALVAVRELVDADPMLLHIHVAEQPHEGAGVLEATGLTVPAFLDELGLLTGRTLGAHCVWMTDDDIDRFARRGAAVAHCPVSNGRHASGIARVAAMRDAGIRVGLGTDGPASNDRLDPFEEMRTAIRYARISVLDAAQLDARTAFGMATAEAGLALGRPDLGRLAPGARADMVAVALDRPGLAPGIGGDELLAGLVWSGSPGLVRDVWVEGAQVVRDGGCLTVDVASAAREVHERSLRLSAPPT